MKAEIIVIGTELLLGQIVDTNSQWIAEQLAELGIDLYYKATVGDNKERLLETLSNGLQRSDLIITTGGLGPTQDDITREVIADSLDIELVKREESLAQVERYFKATNREMSENNLRQAYLPQGAEMIENQEGTAPGFLVEKDNQVIVSLPGVPLEMKAMMKKTVIPYLKEKVLGDNTIHSKVIKTCGIGESDLEEEIADILKEQTNPTIAPLASQGEVKLRLTAKADNKEEAKQLIRVEEERLEERIGEYIYGYNDDTLEKVVANLLWDQELTIAVAESCTGGLIGHRMTNVAGSSAYFERGIISYSNQAKKELLDVKEETLAEFGAVSSQTAKEMALGAKELSNTDIGLSITGIAGPGGATAEKPVGLVYIALADEEGVASYQFNFSGSRLRVKYLTSQTVLNLLRLKLINN
ncbi:competence/damage-inducible protein A [Halanaerocella petrolearia]